MSADEATLDVLTSPQVAIILGVSARTVHRMVAAGRLTPVAKLAGPNGAHLFRPDTIAAYQQANAA